MVTDALGIICQDCVRIDASETLKRYWLQSLARQLLPLEKVADCLRKRAPFKATIDIKKRLDTGRAHYANLIVCSRLWQCPVCAATITENRRAELSQAIRSSDLSPILITYTLRHDKGDKLRDLLPALLESYRRLKSGRKWQNFVADYSWQGSVRSLEVTNGDNGWHPHIHELALLDQPLTPAALEGLKRALKARWNDALTHEGRDANWARGVDVRIDNHDIQEYVAKFGRLPQGVRWTIEHELTKAPSKRGRKAGRTPMQLLWDFGMGDKYAGDLFKEYSGVFKGRNQLVWSRGLREKLGMDKELTDEQLTEKQTATGSVIASLTPAEWFTILSLNHRGELIEYASHHTQDELSDYINDLLSK